MVKMGSLNQKGEGLSEDPNYPSTTLTESNLVEALLASLLYFSIWLDQPARKLEKRSQECLAVFSGGWKLPGAK